MKPILYEQNAFESGTTTPFASQGIGVLADAVSCEITEELNGVYDLEMDYPVDGVHFSDLTLRRIIKAKPNQTDSPQPFRIYHITKPMQGMVTVSAHHLTYDLSGIVVPPFSVNTPGAVIASITATGLPTIQPFSFTNTVTGTKDFSISIPRSGRSILSSFLEIYGGELSYNLANIKIQPQRGANNGATIMYGKNLMDLKQEENCADICTGIFPYYSSNETTVMLSEKIINLPGTFAFRRIIPVDLTTAFPDAAPTQAQLRTAANQYISENNLGVPEVSLTIDYLSIEDSDEAMPLHMFESIAVGDTVKVIFEKMDINTTARCVKYTYDSLLERVKEITVGDKPVTFADTVAEQYSGVQKGEYRALIQDAITRATQAITNGLGGYVIIHKSQSTLTNPDEILILGDSPDISQAQKVWRWNKNGLGYSSTGYGGPYSTAMTANGEIVADMITTGILKAIEITNGNGTFHVTADGQMTATSGTIGGFTIESNALKNRFLRFSNDTGFEFWNSGSRYGRVAVVGDKVFAMILDSAGKTFTLNIEKSDGTLDPIFSYDKSSNNISFFRDVYLHGNKIYNVGEAVPYATGAVGSFIYDQFDLSNNGAGSCVVTIKHYKAWFNACGQYIQTSQTGTDTINLKYWKTT